MDTAHRNGVFRELKPDSLRGTTFGFMGSIVMGANQRVTVEGAIWTGNEEKLSMQNHGTSDNEVTISYALASRQPKIGVLEELL